MVNHDMIVLFLISMSDYDVALYEHDDDHDVYHKYHEYDCRDEQISVRHVRVMFQLKLLYRCRVLVDWYIHSNKVLLLIEPNIRLTVMNQRESVKYLH